MTYTEAIQEILEKSEKWPSILFYIVRTSAGYAVRTEANLAQETPLVTYRAGQIIAAAGRKIRRAYAAISSDGKFRVVRTGNRIYTHAMMTIVPGCEPIASFHGSKAQAEIVLRAQERAIKSGKMLVVPGTRFEIVPVSIIG